ncbi:hypothetical protein [Spirillospora sp. NPDC048823]|uniref:hypothetical protein n=1 Tax=unclassified Spirillospora TaxID=2642701 RepID=UPI00371C8658
MDSAQTDPCVVCADGPQECSCYGEDPECMLCGGSGEAVPEHCCDCEVVGPYCVACHRCGASCAGNCSCPITIERADGTHVTL